MKHLLLLPVLILLCCPGCTSPPSDAPLATIDVAARERAATAIRVARGLPPLAQEGKSTTKQTSSAWQRYYTDPYTTFYDRNGDGRCDKLVYNEGMTCGNTWREKTDTDFDGRFDYQQGISERGSGKIDEAVPDIKSWR